MECKICDREFKTLRALSGHLHRSHDGLKYREYYHKYIIESDAIPTCTRKGCDKDALWVGRTHTTYGKYCSQSCSQKALWTLEKRKKKSEQSKKQMEDPRMREMAAEGARKQWENLEFKEMMAQLTVERWKDPEFRARRSAQKSEEARKYWAENPEQKERMSKMFSELQTNLWSNPEYRAKRLEAGIGIHLTNLHSDPEFRKKMSDSAKRRASTDEYKAWQSEKSKKMWQDPEMRAHLSSERKRVAKEMWTRPEFREKMAGKNGWGNGGHHVSPKVGRVYYRSSYELAAYKILDQLNTVKYYEVEPFGIPYIYNDEEHNYYPDILVLYTDNSKQIIEVKPAVFVEDDVNQAKFRAAEDYCAENEISFTVWTEDNISPILN